jgi:hypothetical protein
MMKNRLEHFMKIMMKTYFQSELPIKEAVITILLNNKDIKIKV